MELALSLSEAKSGSQPIPKGVGMEVAIGFDSREASSLIALNK